MEQLGVVTCDQCGNEIHIEDGEVDFTCDKCGDQVCSECIASCGNHCLKCLDEKE